MRFTFHRKEKLKSRKLIEELFSSGKTIKKFPILLIWKEVTFSEHNSFPIQAAFSVPKRNFKRAVHRNILKRRMRESYRLTKHMWYEQIEESKQYAFLWMYIGKDIRESAEIRNAMERLRNIWEKEH